MRNINNGGFYTPSSLKLISTTFKNEAFTSQKHTASVVQIPVGLDSANRSLFIESYATRKHAVW
jgi:hypothetical protein